MRISELQAEGGRQAAELVDRLPYGVLMVDRAGLVLSANKACLDLLDVGLRRARRRLTCCDLICRLGGDLPFGCLAKRALRADRPLPEIRIDLPPGSSAGAAWVTVATVQPGGERVLFHLRPGEAGDRRRRTAPHWIRGPHLRLFTFGQTGVESDEGSIGGEWIEQRPGQLLKYLACGRGRAVPPDEIAEALWPGHGRRGLGSVRYSIHVLRRRIEPPRKRRAPSSFVVTHRGGYALARERVWIDAEEFEALTTAGMAAVGAGERDTAVRRLERATELYRGDFLADEPYAEWALPERERLRETATEGLRALVELKLASGDIEAAASHSRRLADLDPYDDDSQRRDIEVCLRRARPTEAARRYDLFRKRMMRDLGREPDFRLSDVTV